MPTPWDPYRPASVSGDDKPTVTSPREEASAPVAVPQGTTSELLGWVGDDRDRARRALDAEESTSKPRKGLVEDLKSLLDG